MLNLLMQSQLLNIVRTGDSTIDAILFSVVVALLTFAGAHVKRIVDYLKRHVR